MATFTPSNVVVEGGFLKLRLTAAPGGGAKPYLGGEVRTRAEFTYGRFETRARFARGSGLVSSLFTFYDHLPMNWNEIDIEFLGQYTDKIQYNTIFWDTAQTRLTHEYMDELGFDPASDFHVYAIEWVPGAVRFLIDGEVRHTETEGISQYMKLPQRVMMNLWPANVEEWVGPIDASAIPTESQYDWVAVYRSDP
jgi:beta-glucanase (GH16 family)